MLFLQTINLLLHTLHLLVVILVLFGWLWEKTRLLNLYVILLSVVSWYFLGLWYGKGFCILTHWQHHLLVLLDLGEIEGTFVAYAVYSITSLRLSDAFLEPMSDVVIVLIFLISLHLNIRETGPFSHMNTLRMQIPMRNSMGSGPPHPG